jgi:hypothetical protein
MAGRKSIFTPEMQELILNNFRHTGNLKNSAIRAGMSERSFYRWKELCEKAKSGPLYRFWQEVTRAKADRLAMLASRHYLRSVGGVFRMPVYDSSFNLVCDQSGKPVTIAKVLPPDARAMWREMTLLDPETYGPQRKAAVSELPPSSQQYAKPRDLLPMLYDVMQRLKNRGIDFETHGIKPAIESTATSADTATSAEPAPETDGAQGCDELKSR